MSEHVRTRPSKWRARATTGAVAVASALALSACGGGGSAPGSSSSTTLPPLPPTVTAFVTLAGSGNNIGYGSTVVPVNITAGAGGPQVGTKIHVGTYPDAIAVNPAGTMAYVANYSANTVTPINLRTDKAKAPIPAGIGPAGIAVNPAGTMAYVTDDGSASTLGDTITPIDLRTDKAKAPITVGKGPQGIVITPDGRTAYVADAGAIVSGQAGGIGNTVTPVDLVNGTAGRPITVGNGPVGIAITPDGSTVFVTNLDSGSVSPISVANNTAGAPIAIEGGPVAVVVAKNDAWVVDTSSGSYAGNNLTPISINTDQAGTPIPVGKGAQGIAVAPNGRTAWVTCLYANTIVQVNLARQRAGAVIHLAGGPFAVAIAQQAQGAPAGTTPKHTKKKKH